MPEPDTEAGKQLRAEWNDKIAEVSLALRFWFAMCLIV
jgi:hypothetical protein